MYSRLFSFIPPSRCKVNEPMKEHCTFKVGGPADLMILPQNAEEIQEIIRQCKQERIPYLFLGLGSNILVRDKGIRGIVIKVGDYFKNITIDNDTICAEAGARLADISRIAAEHSLSGLEFAEGIPGSLGGAVVMNAGAYGGEMKDILVGVQAIMADGTLSFLEPEEMKLDYRSSIFQEGELLVLSALLQLHKGVAEDIQKRMQEYAGRRQEKQPLEYPSAGSTFRRPPGYYVGPMIEEMGLKGYRIGGAEISRKHAGFIVNSGNASASDILELIDFVKNMAKEHYGVELETEIKIVGEE